MMVQQLVLKLVDTADGLFRAYCSFSEGHHAIYVRNEEAAALSAWHSRHSTAGMAQQAQHDMARYAMPCHAMPCHASVKCFACMAARARMIRKVQHNRAVLHGVQACMQV